MEQVGDAGQAVFPAVPARFRGQAVAVSLLSDAYEAAAPAAKLRLTPPLVYLAARLRKRHVSFHVEDERGAPVSGAEIRVDSEFLGDTNDAGDLQTDLIPNSADQIPKLRVRKTGYQPYAHGIEPGHNQIEVQLRTGR
jgi:hypothetical protein